MKSSLLMLSFLISATALANPTSGASNNDSAPAQAANAQNVQRAPAEKAPETAAASTDSKDENSARHIEIDRTRSFEARPVASSRDRSMQHR